MVAEAAEKGLAKSWQVSGEKLVEAEKG